MAKMMDPAEQRFEQYLERLAAIVAHADRGGPLRAYLTGLYLPGDRKSVEPMAARIDPRHVSSRHQSMHHFVAKAEWEDGDLGWGHCLTSHCAHGLANSAWKIPVPFITSLRVATANGMRQCKVKQRPYSAQHPVVAPTPLARDRQGVMC